MTMRDRNDPDERRALHEDDRVREPCQQLATHTKLARKSEHRPAFGSRGLERPHRRFDLLPELGAQTFTLTLVAVDRVRDLFVGLRVECGST